ncbi:MAG: helix-turn-helix domain-containing protein [Candidatus Moraniibacteriota bacterium]
MKQAIALKILASGANVFLTGSAGTGKTFVINKYIRYLRERGVEPAIVAPTGIAASHIGGKTIHSFFGLGIRENIEDYYLRWLKKQPFLEKRFKYLKVLIIDEISMVSPELFGSMDRILRAFKENEKPFGGVQVVLSGDFFQLPPVAKGPRQIKFVWQTELWRETGLRICYLQEKFRQGEDELAGILDEIRSGEVSEDSMDIFRSCYKKNLAAEINITKLYTHNIDVDRINDTELQKLPGKEIVFKANTKGSKQNLERIFKGALVQEELRLKKDATIIFIKNNYGAGYINGTLGRVVDFERGSSFPIVELFDGKKIIVSPEEWLWEDDKGKIKAVVKQLPLKLAWALTVHKSQGMTLDAAEIDLSKTFEVGQGYVALSRVKSIRGLRLMGLNDIALRVDEAVLEADKEMQTFSRLNFSEFEDLAEELFEEVAQNFILAIGGEIEAEKIRRKKEELEKGKEENKKSFRRSGASKRNTLELTKELVKRKLTLKKIAQERGLSLGTIVEHLAQIKKLLPDLDLDYLKPEEKKLKPILKAVDEIKRKKNPENFSPDGQLKLKPIFESLGGKTSYEDIKLALIFRDK